MKIQTTAALAIMAIAGSTQAQLLNPSFETPGFPDVFNAWGQFGGNINPDLDELILDGDVSAKIFGNFTGGFNNSGMFQTITATVNPGDIWQASINTAHLSGDELQEGALAFLSLVYIDANGVNLYDYAVDALTPSDPADTFILRTAADVAPLGAAQVQIVIGLNQFAPTADVNGDTVIDGGDQPTGAIIFDGANLAIADAAGPCCDQNGDMVCSPADFSAWVANFNSGNLDADVNRDGAVSPADFSAWVAAFNLGIASGATCN